MRESFLTAVHSNQSTFGVDLDEKTAERLADYYDLVQEHNTILHLVAPSSPEDFATRHILESLTLLQYLPAGARFADIGPGAGLPSIPCLIVRPDVSAVLIESKEKKAGFLRKAIAKCNLESRAEIVNRQFSETARPDVSYVTCRALDKFTQNIPQLLKWSGDCTLLFFGGPTLGDEIRMRGYNVEASLMPLSERRYLFRCTRRRNGS